ncbi:MAG: radical SAM protein [Pseudobdellovibrionaceae bacterium]|nr:radical SAM protein [Pseudobdellovibrionaceae bacterium]
MSDGSKRKPLRYASGMFTGSDKKTSIIDGIKQDQNPYRELAAYHPKRLTVQWLNACNLACPGCYAKPDLAHGKAIDTSARRPTNQRTNSARMFEEHVLGHGDAIQQVYILGLEPTIVPQQTKDLFDRANVLGLSAITATNGASSRENYEMSYRTAIESGQMHRVNISIDDAVDAEVNDRLRGKSGAQASTLNTIRHAVEQGDPIQITITVWAENYRNVIGTINKLNSMGVRAFKLHEGSLEGAPDFQEVGANRVDPLSWRALISQVHKLKQSLQKVGALDNLVIPTIYYSREELVGSYIGDEGLTEAYIQQQKNIELGIDSQMPFVSCPSVNVDQTYMFGNDGKYGAGAVGLCSIHTVGHSSYLADYDPEKKEFVTETDPDRNQIAVLQKSKNMCPAFTVASRDEVLIRGENISDRHETEVGDLYHGCRQVSSNHLATNMDFGADYYVEAVQYSDFLRHRADWSMSVDVLRVHKGGMPYVQKMAAIKNIDERSSGKRIFWMELKA